MLIVHDSDKYKYYYYQLKDEIIKYTSDIQKIYNVKAKYLPRRLHNNDRLFYNIITFV